MNDSSNSEHFVKRNNVITRNPNWLLWVVLLRCTLDFRFHHCKQHKQHPNQLLQTLVMAVSMKIICPESLLSC